MMDDDDLDFYEDGPYCDHDEYEVSWEGRATCDRCHHSWWLTAAQHAEHDRFMAEWHEQYDRAMRRETHWFWRWCDAVVRWARDLFRPKPRLAAADCDGEIPF